MKIDIRIIPNAGKNKILKQDNGLKIYINAPAVEGKANKALINILADYFDLPKSRINIIKGEKSRNKIVDIT